MSSYRDLGVTPIINAFDTITTLGGSLMPPQVLNAMAEAAEDFIDLPDLLQKACARIASLTRNEGACISAGAACGLLLAAAAFMTQGDPEKADRLPDTAGMKNEIIVQRCQRMGWNRGLRQAGATVVEAGDAGGVTREEFLSAFSDRTAGVLYYASPVFEKGALPLADVLALAHERGVPVAVDAAANLPPVENLWGYTALGADLAVFSGGKGLCGPQNTGLVLGRKQWTDACMQSASPGGGIGRVAKVGKEEVMGLLAAVERFVALDHDGERALREEWVARAVARLQAAGLDAGRLYPGIHGQSYPRVRLALGSKQRRDDTLCALRAGEPPIVAGAYPDEPEVIVLNPLTLKPGQMEHITDRLLAILGPCGG